MKKVLCAIIICVLAAAFFSCSGEKPGNNETSETPEYRFAAMGEETEMQLIDINLDGYKDVIIPSSKAGANGTVCMDCWLWDAETAGFAYAPSFSQMQIRRWTRRAALSIRHISRQTGRNSEYINTPVMNLF